LIVKSFPISDSGIGNVMTEYGSYVTETLSQDWHLDVALYYPYIVSIIIDFCLLMNELQTLWH